MAGGQFWNKVFRNSDPATQYKNDLKRNSAFRVMMVIIMFIEKLDNLQNFTQVNPESLSCTRMFEKFPSIKYREEELHGLKMEAV